MGNENTRMMAMAACLTCVVCFGQVAPKGPASDSKARVSDPESIQVLWSGSWGGGVVNGVGFQPVMAELMIKGDHVELCGFRNVSRLTGTVRLNAKARHMQISPTAEAGGQSTQKTIDYTYEIKGDELTLTDSDKFSIALQKRRVAQNPLANAQVELVAAAGINETGELLVTEYTVLRAGRAGALYFQPESRSLKTQHATVLLVEETGLKKIPLAEARRLIRTSMPVVVAYRPDDRPLPHQLHELWKEMGPAMPDSDAVSQTFLRILRPGTLVFILSARDNITVP